MCILNEPAKQEIKISSLLQVAVKRKIQESKLNEEQVAEKLSLLPSGAEGLFAKANWPIDTAFRVASAFGIDMLIDVKK